MRNELLLDDPGFLEVARKGCSRERTGQCSQRGDLKPMRHVEDAELSRLGVERGGLGAGPGPGTRVARCHHQRDPTLDVTAGSEILDAVNDSRRLSYEIHTKGSRISHCYLTTILSSRF